VCGVCTIVRTNALYVVLQMHTWDDGTPVEETMGAFADLVRAGKVRYVGVSNLTGWQFQKLVEVGRRLGVPIVSDQVSSIWVSMFMLRSGSGIF